MLCCETWSTENILPECLHKLNFQTVFISATKDPNIKKSRPKGGLVCLISDVHKLEVLFSNDVIIFIYLENLNLVLGLVYANPTGDFDYVLDLCVDLINLYNNKWDGVNIIIFGDFNARIGEVVEGESCQLTQCCTSFGQV